MDAAGVISPPPPFNGMDDMLEICDSETGLVTPMSELQAMEHVRQLECMHQANTTAIDKFHDELRHYTMILAQGQKEDDDEQAQADQQWVEVEKAKAEQEWIILALQNELNALEERREHNATVAGELRQMAETTMQQGGDLAEDDELINVVEARETHLRGMEDRAVWVEDMVEDRKVEAGQLETEHAALVRSGAHYFSETEYILRELQQASDERTAEQRSLLQRKAGLEAEVRALTDAKDHVQRYHDECDALKRTLELDLAQNSSDRDAASYHLNQMLVEALGEKGSDEMLRKLDEIMMGLKAHAIQLHHDHAFTEDVYLLMNTPELALDGFHVAFQYVEEYVTAVYGEQAAGERWRLDQSHETRYDEVEALLSSLKQLVICYDAMQTAQKRRIEVAFIVVRNATHLNRLAVDTSVKFAEMLEARERQKQRDAEARQERVKRTLARNREQSARRRAAVDIPPAERASQAAQPMAQHAPGPKRDASPKLAPRQS
eukprot:TRINITY_DN19109_c0_g1_i1.p1 TRINITY_DN19109_c0_g1~~TRINITY_DN19109_c0_g1_i1.p1  ORF type:complete len:493 (+),score=214.70 TRINITY_DN19109_c0_g1_i1:84-1562(+)